MRHDEVKDLLRSVRRLSIDAQLAYNRWQRLRSNAERATAQYNGLPFGSHGDPRKDALWQEVANAHEQVLTAYLAAAKREKEANELIDRLEKREHRAVLHYRYLADQSWPDVQASMEAMNLPYSDRHLFNLHGEALRELRQIYRKEHARHEDSDSSVQDK